MSTQAHPLSKIINNYLTFQLAWIASAYWHDYRATLVSVGCLFWLYLAEPWSKHRFFQTLQLAGLGIVADSLLTLAQVLVFESSLGPLPIWLYALWLVFASTLTMSLIPLLKTTWLAATLGAIFGPLAYWAGAQFDALTLTINAVNLASMMIIWAAYFIGASLLIKRHPPTPSSLEVKQ